MKYRTKESGYEIRNERVWLGNTERKSPAVKYGTKESSYEIQNGKVWLCNTERKSLAMEVRDERALN